MGCQAMGSKCGSGWWPADDVEEENFFLVLQVPFDQILLELCCCVITIFIIMIINKRNVF